MEKFINNKKLVYLFGKRSRLLAVQKFDSKKIAKRSQKLLKNVEYQA